MGIVLFSQEPMIFSGTLRENLDPAGKCSDREMWEALGQVKKYFFFKHVISHNRLFFCSKRSV